jgi:peptidoglycan/LPS O-acetylase OafA/YrhL
VELDAELFALVLLCLPPKAKGAEQNRGIMLSKVLDKLEAPAPVIQAHEGAPRLDALTSLRFFAAAMLVVFHGDLFLNNMPQLFGAALKQGVCFFFVLSGFILFYNYQSLNNARECARFLIARFARIWPAQAAATVLVMLLLPQSSWGVSGGDLFWIVLSGLLMMQSYIPTWRYYLGINAPAWSISTEFFFYLTFPFLISNWRKTWLAKLSSAAVLAISFVALTAYLGVQPFTYKIKTICDYLIYINPAARLVEFVLGMVTAYAYLSVRASFGSKVAAISSLQFSSVVLVGITLVACHTPIEELSKQTHSATATWVYGSGGCFAFALLIFSMAFSQGILSKLLSHPFLVLLGEISYSIYLLHWLAYKLLLLHLHEISICVSRPIYLTGFALALFSSSYLMYRFVERPCRRYLTKTLFDAWDRRFSEIH